ncbi:tyrosine-type recombinase/integrase [Jiella sp. M17.18]|uniref:tyrosine-type recombinase/integrase n=1 Tax=Jiella sp. M17.18 TaxID=3234247 RepID=UPI0034DF0367
MARFKLSETNLKTLEKPGMHSDGDGLYLRVQKSGSKNWVFVYRRGSKRTELGLGGYGRGTAPVSLKLAREKAELIRQQLANGEDPRAERKAPKIVTFADCMAGLIEARKNDWGNPKHRDQFVMTLQKYAAPLHDMPIADIKVGDVKATLMPHWSARPETADRLRSRIGMVIDYGIAHQWRDTANPAKWTGLLDKVMPARQKLTRGHHAALPYKDAPAMCARLRGSSGTAARLVEFLTLTAVRTSEARKAVWGEFDFDEAVWTIPADRMKAGKQHRVPLTPRMVQILEARRQRSTGEYVFADTGKPVSGTAMTKALKLAVPKDVHVTLHGLRSMFRDWAGEETDHPREIAEAALAHAVGDAVERAYRRSDALDKRRALMTDWETYCSRGGRLLTTISTSVAALDWRADVSMMRSM